ncbi:hypothetical protein AGR56_04235 [Clostridium sp. DMHC 10]|uniref:GIY-YIG nuclease family protein n=1 Tax=Clostridium sp. DMHC 10 TaxID=747377 RepID=UPI00069FC87C|nr:GIY-YIG nuclease family protein [Clostridium sp. DMHC 10]KOF56134.1 hypothetical protein AGR56_04235 [Clostridium sp. DMHC 10]
MDLIEILQLRKFDLSKKIKLVRHTTENGYDVNLIYKAGQLRDYQAVQSKDFFKDCEYIISFIATESTKAIFVGAYEIVNKTTVKQRRKIKKLPDIQGIPDFYKGDQFYYEQIEVTILADLKDRLVIEWGKGARNWCQNLSNKEVVEILPKGYYNNFPGFDKVIINYDELKKIIDYSDANREWHKMLSSVAGVYLIVDMETGMQYVGSAYGKEGILGRWKQYSKNGHGGNKLLIDILEKAPLRYKKFQYSILRTLPRTLTSNEVIEIESIYKRKLGSKAFGLNLN